MTFRRIQSVRCSHHDGLTLDLDYWILLNVYVSVMCWVHMHIAINFSNNASTWPIGSYSHLLIFITYVNNIVSHYYHFCSYSLVLSVEFDQVTYAGLESSGVITVTLSLSGGTSTNDIIVTVIPSDQSSVSAEGKESMSCTY